MNRENKFRASDESGNTVHLTINRDVYSWLEFTGRHDKNDKEIYEGDIMSIDGCHMIVTWDSENLQWIVRSNDMNKPDLELWYVLDDGPDSFVIDALKIK